MNTLRFVFKSPKDGLYYQGGCPMVDDLTEDRDRTAATARMLFLESIFEIDKDKQMPLEEFKFWDSFFPYADFDLTYWIEEAAE